MTQDEIDARRYRWLRDAPCSSDDGGVEVLIWSKKKGVIANAEGRDLGMAIDAAMADEPRYTITAKGKAMLEGK